MTAEERAKLTALRLAPGADVVTALLRRIGSFESVLERVLREDEQGMGANGISVELHQDIHRLLNGVA